MSGDAAARDGTAGALAREVVGGALGLESSELAADTAIGTTERWDSLAHMRIILGLEERLDRQLTADEVVEIATLNDVERIRGDGQPSGRMRGK